MSRSKYQQVVDYFPKLIYPEKYTGARPLTLRSSWEIRFVKKYLDINKNILEWSSESVVIPYIFSVDHRRHRYFPDFWMKVREEPNGVIKEYIIEIKPFNQTQPPKVPKRKTKKYENRIIEFIKNTDKWKYAQQFCEQMKHNGRDMEFKIITEKELGL